MKVTTYYSAGEATIELIPETTADRDALNLAVNSNQTAKVKKNGTCKFIMQVAQVAIGRSVMELDKDSGEMHKDEGKPE